jgi:hypothetical protein
VAERRVVPPYGENQYAIAAGDVGISEQQVRCIYAVWLRCVDQFARA